MPENPIDTSTGTGTGTTPQTQQTTFRNEFGKEINISGNFSESAQKQYDQYIKEREAATDDAEIEELNKKI